METNATATVRNADNYTDAILPLYRAVAKKEIEVETDAYQINYGHAPKGRGCWWFLAASGHVIAVSSTTYAEAKKGAVAKAAECGLAGRMQVMT